MAKKDYMERTPEMLQYVADNPGATSSEMGKNFGLAQSTCAVKLKHFYDRNWVEREKTVPRGLTGRFAYTYTITERGKGKLEYWDKVQVIVEKQDVDWGRARRLLRTEEEL